MFKDLECAALSRYNGWLIFPSVRILHAVLVGDPPLSIVDDEEVADALISSIITAPASFLPNSFRPSASLLFLRGAAIKHVKSQWTFVGESPPAPLDELHRSSNPRRVTARDVGRWAAGGLEVFDRSNFWRNLSNWKRSREGRQERRGRHKRDHTSAMSAVALGSNDQL